MGLISQDTRRVDVPGEPGAWVEIRQLGWRKLEAARKAQDKEQRGIMKDFGAEFVKALSSGDADKARDTARQMRWDAEAFDRMTLFGAAVSGWSYNDGKSEPTAANFGDLEEATAEWLVGAILDYARPPGGEELKKTAAASTPTSTV